MLKNLITLGLAASAAAAPLVRAPVTAQNKDLEMEYTVSVSEPFATPVANPSASADPEPTPTAADIVEPTPIPTETSTETETEAVTEMAETKEDAPMEAVVPVHICTGKQGTHCLTTRGSEFANTKLSWDQVATFNLGLDGLLVRIDDLKCVEAVPMDDATWYDIAYIDCELPLYLQGALALQQEKEAAASAAPSPSAAPVSRRDTTVRVRSHTAWFYDREQSYLCAKVDDGLNEVDTVCLYSEEGYAMLGTVEQLQDVDKVNREVSMPVTGNDDATLAENLYNMLEAMTYDGTIFWSAAWDTNLQSVMKYRMMGAQSEDVYLGRDEMMNVIQPLWQIVNECRQKCDITEWCHSFTFRIDDCVCTLSDAFPVIKPGDVDPKNPDTVTFVQNANYNRSDYVLEDEEDQQ